MLQKINPAETQSWKRLSVHFDTMKRTHMKDLFAGDRARAEKFSLVFNDILIDYSKNIINEDTVTLLLGLAEETGLRDAIKKMFEGDVINGTERRAVLHT
ncbi:MAG: glucose-6-phosphate isomerase, partial [Candidatus Latescibacterota bacterium]